MPGSSRARSGPCRSPCTGRASRHPCSQQLRSAFALQAPVLPVARAAVLAPGLPAVLVLARSRPPVPQSLHWLFWWFCARSSPCRSPCTGSSGGCARNSPCRAATAPALALQALVLAVALAAVLGVRPCLHSFLFFWGARSFHSGREVL
jgi:hypothetical protein